MPVVCEQDWPKPPLDGHTWGGGGGRGLNGQRFLGGAGTKSKAALREVMNHTVSFDM